MLEHDHHNRQQAIKILLVEDDDVEREHLSRVLVASFDVSIHTATCLQDGIELLRETPFEVVLFDLGLPDSYGLDTVKRMVEEFPATPMVVLTGLMDEAVAREASALGICDYLVKGKATASDIVSSISKAAASRSSLPVRC